jgi:hypothetical protein
MAPRHECHQLIGDDGQEGNRCRSIGRQVGSCRQRQTSQVTPEIHGPSEQLTPSPGTLVEPATLSGDPAAEVINPVVRAGNSPLAFPSAFGLLRGELGYGDGRRHGTSCHSVLG